MKVSAIIIAAGLGKRMGTKMPKQFLTIGGRPILHWTLEKFDRCHLVNFIVIVTEESMIPETEEIVRKSSLSKEWLVVAGGKERQDSVRNGLNSVPLDTDIVVVHDGVRPFINPDIIDRSVVMAKKHGGCIVAVPISDTVKRAADYIQETIDRATLFAAQTPQTFKYGILKKAFDDAYKEGYYGTDDASLVERIGERVKILIGSKTNIKITTPEDLKIADAISTKGKNMRIGYGYDLHRLSEGRKLILGGVQINHEKGLLGHSDADVLLHAVTDALLGAASLGDIGRHFPDTDPKFKDANSRDLLKSVVRLVHKNGYEIKNIDATIVAEKPKMAPYIEKMRMNMSEDLETDIDAISIKAKTNEGLGSIGREEAIAVQAVALLAKEQ